MLTEGLELLPGPVLAQRSTLRLGGQAWAELLLQTEQGFNFLAQNLHDLGGHPAILGRGSNILAQDGPLPLVVISCGKDLGGPPTLRQDYGKEVLVSCGAGHSLSMVVHRLAEAGLSGLESLAGIPGTVGGAVAMNAGSFGTEISQCLHSAHIYTPEHGLKEYQAEELKMGYRSFALPQPCEWFVVAKAMFRLQRKDKLEILSRMSAVLDSKKASQPLSAATTGSTFKNPVGIAAGRLLEQSGFKGYTWGGMGFSEKHANFMVNRGNGTAAQALELIEQARSKVLTISGIALELEVKIWP